LRDQLNLNSDTLGQTGDADRSSGVPTRIAKEIDQQLGRRIRDSRQIVELRLTIDIAIQLHNPPNSIQRPDAIFQ
jgi:Flp pilus assembly CpaF family ATPase